MSVRIGVISDTHGLLRPDVFHHLEGVERILHAGDVGPAELLVELEAVAPVTAVYGNTDDLELRERLQEVERLELGGVRAVLLHGDQLGTPTPEGLARAYPDADLVVYGHTHRPLIQTVGSTLTLNPGSAGPRRFRLPATLSVLELDDGGPRAQIIELEGD